MITQCQRWHLITKSSSGLCPVLVTPHLARRVVPCRFLLLESPEHLLALLALLAPWSASLAVPPPSPVIWHYSLSPMRRVIRQILGPGSPRVLKVTRSPLVSWKLLRSLVHSLSGYSHGCIQVSHPWLCWWLPPVFVSRLLLTTEKYLKSWEKYLDSLASYNTLGYRGLHWVSESCSHTHSTPSTSITENVTFLLGSIGW